MEAAKVAKLAESLVRVREEEERSKRGRTPIQVSASHTNRTDVTESHCLL
jgi:hypothetical protein